MILLIDIHKSGRFDNKYNWNNTFSNPNAGFYFQYDEKNFFIEANNNKYLFSERPVFYKANSYSYLNGSNINLYGNYVELLKHADREFVGLCLTMKENSFSVCCNSAKVGRGRLYYLVDKNHEYIILSDKLTNLIEFSDKQLNPEIAFGILKFGITPEYFSIIDGIFSVPASNYLYFNSDNVNEFIRNKNNHYSWFKPYFQIKYTFTGGSLDQTETILKNIMKFMVDGNPDVFISGGIDSTLINHLYSEVTDNVYNAHYLYFGENDTEIEYAKEAVKGTKAELQIWQMTQKEFLPSFRKSIDYLIEPTADAIGSSVTGAFLAKTLGDTCKRTFIDCTVADSCYGSKNYLTPLPLGTPTNFPMALIKEKIEFLFKYYNLKGYKKINPCDKHLNDPYLQYMVYSKVFLNCFSKQAKHFTKELLPKYQWAYNLIDPAGKTDDYVKYTVLQLFLYASKQTTVKFYDMMPQAKWFYPFMFRAVLEDQGHYTWQEKTANGVIKAPLKKILEKYMDKDFIYRKKMGLNNPNYIWVNKREIKNELLSIALKNGGINEVLFSKSGITLFNKAVNKEKHHPDLDIMLVQLSTIQAWADKYKLVY